MPGKLLKLLQLISILKASRWTIKQLMERFEISRSNMYRYMDVLEEAGFYLDKDNHDRYFIVTTEDNPDQSQFSLEEMTLLRNLIAADNDHPLRGSLLKKLSLQSEIDNMPRLFLKAYLGNVVGQLMDAIRNKHQVILRNYHSANSNTIGDRLVEPVHFGDNYATIIALDIQEMTCKSFKLDRIGEVIETHKPFLFEDDHEHRTTDMFGIAGKDTTIITLHLTLRAYMLLREEFPLAARYLKSEGDNYIFNGPVASFRGVGRFVMGLLDEVKIVAPEEFRMYLVAKVKRTIDSNAAF